MSAEAARAPGGLAAKSVVARFVAGAAVDSFGTGMSAAAVVLYFVTIVGFSPGAVTGAMSAGALAGLLAPIPFGVLADRIGLVRVYCGTLAVRGVGFIAYAAVGDYRAFVLITLVLMAFENVTSSLQQSLVSRIFADAARVRVMAAVRATRNAALGAGTLVAALALTTKSHQLVALLLVANGLSFFVLAGVVFSLRGHIARAGAGPRAAASGADGAPPAVRNARFVGLAALNGLLLLHDSVLFVLLPLWTVYRLGLSPGAAPLLLALNTGLSVLLQTVFSRTDRFTRANGPTLLACAAFLVAACLAFVVAEQVRGWAAFGVALGAVGLLTLGENLHSVAGWQVSFALAPAARRSEYMAAFNTSYGFQRIVGPVFATGVVLARGAPGWLLLGALFAAAALAFNALAGRQLAALPAATKG